MIELEKAMGENPTGLRVAGELLKSLFRHPGSLPDDARGELLIRAEARRMDSETWNDERTSQVRNTLVFMLGDQTLKTIVRLDKGLTGMQRDIREWASDMRYDFFNLDPEPKR